MRVPVGLDITEVWEVDLCLEAKRYEIEILERVVARAQEDAGRADDAGQVATARVAAAAATLAQAQAELAAYEGGTGPRITLGHIPAAKRAEIAGMMSDADRLTTDRERAAAQHAWRRQVVRWAVRGHANLRTARGAEVPFESEPVTIAGETLQVPTERQIERYGAFLADLANVAMAPQRLSDVEKNG